MNEVSWGHRILQWVGAERGTRRPVSPLPPLRPYMRLSHSYGHRQEDLQGSSFPEPLRVHSPRFPSQEFLGPLPSQRRSFPMWTAFLPSEYYDRVPLSIHVVLLPTRRLVPNSKLSASHFGLCSRSGVWGFIPWFPLRLLIAPIAIPWRGSRVRYRGLCNVG